MRKKECPPFSIHKVNIKSIGVQGCTCLNGSVGTELAHLEGPGHLPCIRQWHLINGYKLQSQVRFRDGSRQLLALSEWTSWAHRAEYLSLTWLRMRYGRLQKHIYHSCEIDAQKTSPIKDFIPASKINMVNRPSLCLKTTLSLFSPWFPESKFFPRKLNHFQVCCSVSAFCTSIWDPGSLSIIVKTNHPFSAAKQGTNKQKCWCFPCIPVENYARKVSGHELEEAVAYVISLPLTSNMLLVIFSSEWKWSWEELYCVKIFNVSIPVLRSTKEIQIPLSYIPVPLRSKLYLALFSLCHSY